jgi:hypothetical protein
MFGKKDDDDELFKKLKEEEQKRHQSAVDALTLFVSKYSPATNETADTFFSSAEISQAIAEHTGVVLSRSDIYELMSNMKYTFDTRNGLEFNWLLKKE